MKAIVLHEPGGSEKLCNEELPPPRPAFGQVLVQLQAAALNHRDILVRVREQYRAAMPFVPGSDGAGIVTELGPGVSGVRVGEGVVIYPGLSWGIREACPGPAFRILGGPDNGTFAEYVCVPLENVFPKPPNLSFAEAAALPAAGLTVWRALVTKAQVRAGESVLIHGIGSGSGILALQIARLLGARVFVTSHSDEKLRRARGLGAEAGINYSTTDWIKKVTSLTDGYGVDIVIDSVGSATFAKSLDVMAPGGRLVTFGTTSGAMTELEIRPLYHKQLTVLGTTCGSPGEFADLLRAVEASRLVPVVDRVFPLASAAEAYQYLEEQRQFGKVVLDIGGSQIKGDAP